MRLLDADAEKSLFRVQLYLTPSEAAQFRAGLDELLNNPEAAEHRHVLGDGRDISLSIVTTKKLANLRAYTEMERRVLQER